MLRSYLAMKKKLKCVILEDEDEMHQAESFTLNPEPAKAESEKVGSNE